MRQNQGLKRIELIWELSLKKRDALQELEDGRNPPFSTIQSVHKFHNIYYANNMLASLVALCVPYNGIWHWLLFNFGTGGAVNPDEAAHANTVV